LPVDTILELHDAISHYTMSNPSKYWLRQTPQSKPGFFKAHDDPEIDESDCSTNCDCSTDDGCDVAGDEEYDDSSTDESHWDSASSFIASDSDEYNTSDTFSLNSDDQFATESEYEFSEEDEDFLLSGTDDEAEIAEAYRYMDDALEEPKSLGPQRGV